MALTPGTRLGPYKILSTLGVGGMGEVYKAHDSKLDRAVALKLLLSATAHDPDRLRRFHAEARAASSLNHPHILVIHDFGEIDGRPSMVTEFVEGETLRDRLSRGALPIKDVLQIAAQLTSALGAAHARGIVHRDIKPENVMIRPDGYVKVLDFGLVKLMTPAVAEDLTVSGNTEPGLMLGTPRYMSPEQARGLQADPRSDVWSVGVLLYELVAGRPPFLGPSTADLIAAILNHDPSPLDIAAPGAPEGLARIVATAMAKEPSRRYSSAVELHAELTELLAAIDSGIQLSLPIASSSTRHSTVGREKERTELLGAFRRAASGHGELLSISGEPGAGKTTIVEDFLAGLATMEARCRIGRGRCSERLAGAEAYLPVLEALDSLLHAGDSTEVARQIAAAAPAWYSQLATDTSPSGVARAAPESQAGSQERLKREIAALVRELSRAQPLILFFDDVHWADASTIDLLAYLAPRFADARLLIIVTSRPSDLLLANHPFLSLRRDLQAKRLCHDVTLEMLTRVDVDRYLGLEFPGHVFPDELSGLIHAKTEGSPLFMADLVRYLAANGTLVRNGDGRWTLDGSLHAIGAELPESVRAMIERKITQLGEEDRLLLTVASVQGYEFDSAVVAQVLAQDPARVEAQLDTLERVHRFVRLIDEREFPDRTVSVRYRFVHVLYQNALYAQLRATRKVTLCAAVAQTLSRLYGARHTEIASELAALYEASRDNLRAAEYCRIAAQHAAQLFASQEALVLAKRGVGLLQSMPNTVERQETELALLVTLGNAFIAARGYASDEVLDTYTRAHALCEQLGETPHLSAVLYGFAAMHLVGGRHPTALQYGTQLLALTERRGDPALVVGHRLVGWPLLAMGRLDDALQHFEQVAAIYDPATHRALAYSFGQDPGMASRIMQAVTLWLLGRADEAQRCRHEALELANQTTHANSRCYGFHFASVYDQLAGDRRSAMANAETVSKLADEQGLALWLGWSVFMQGWGSRPAGIRMRACRRCAAASTPRAPWVRRCSTRTTLRCSPRSSCALAGSRKPQRPSTKRTGSSSRTKNGFGNRNWGGCEPRST